MDTRNTATASTRVYYTPDFKRRVSDPKGHIRNLMDVTNNAFAQTQIPLRLSELCIEELNIGESSSSSQRMRDIRSAKGSDSGVMNGADIVVVMFASMVSTTIIFAHENQTKKPALSVHRTISITHILGRQHSWSS